MSPWPWSPAQHKELLKLVEPVVDSLRRFRTAGTGEPVDPSHLRAIAAFIQQDGNPVRVGDFLRLAPRSHMARYTRSAGPQLEKACQQAREVIKKVKHILPEGSSAALDRNRAQAVVFVLSHAARMVRTQERRDEQHRQNRGRPGGGRGRSRQPRGRNSRRW